MDLILYVDMLLVTPPLRYQLVQCISKAMNNTPKSTVSVWGGGRGEGLVDA